MEIVLNILAVAFWGFVLWIIYRQERLLKLRTQVLKLRTQVIEMNHGRIRFLESQLDQCYEAAYRRTTMPRQIGDNNVALAHVNGLVADYHGVRLQRNYLLKVLEEYKARYGKLAT